MKVGPKTVQDATLNLGYIQKVTQGGISKQIIYNALATNDVEKLRELSNYFFKTSGIYQRACTYAANLYRYDWYVTSESYADSPNVGKIKKELKILLKYLDNSYIKKMCGDISLQVIKNGAYYGYIVPSQNNILLQELPIGFCRSRYSTGQLPVIEFNMSFFDKAFPDAAYRQKVLNMFPEEFKKGYYAYHSNKLLPENWFDKENGWWPLDPQNTVKFSFNPTGNNLLDIPMFINSLPAILDLDAAQDLDRRKQMQKLLKIIIQKLPMDKNGDLIFDGDEVKDIHNTAVQMLGKAIGVDVLTTFADIDSVDMSDKNTTATQDDLEKVERTVYNALGISKNLFNSDGNIALSNSILNDESTLRNLILQYNAFFDRIVSRFSSSKQHGFRFYMLETTQYNYKEMSKLFKEQVQLGYPKLLTQIALGQSQSAILNTIYFENEVLNLSEIMLPPLMSSTLSMEDLANKNSNSGDGSVGRPEKEDTEKSDKTLQNQESMS